MKASVILAALVACIFFVLWFGGLALLKNIALIVIPLVVVIILFMLAFGDYLIEWFSNVEERIDSGVQTGPAPLTVIPPLN